jgi:hypothetical protein
MGMGYSKTMLYVFLEPGSVPSSKSPIVSAVIESVLPDGAVACGEGDGAEEVWGDGEGALAGAADSEAGDGVPGALELSLESEPVAAQAKREKTVKTTNSKTSSFFIIILLKRILNDGSNST